MSWPTAGDNRVRLTNQTDASSNPTPRGGWKVTARNADRASGLFETQAAAIGRAREILGNQGGGELEIRGTDGKVRQQDTIPPANDPRSSKG